MPGDYPLVFWQGVLAKHAKVLLQRNRPFYSEGQARIPMQDPLGADQV